MDKRENLLAMLLKKDYSKIPCEFMLCPFLIDIFKEKTGSDMDYMDYYEMPWKRVSEIMPNDINPERFKRYYESLKPGTKIDIFGVAHEPGSAYAKHMTYMRNPLKNISDIKDLEEYPFPSFDNVSNEKQKEDVENLHNRGIASIGNMQMTIWETAWTIRSMEDLMVDMMVDDEMATYLLDKIMNISTQRAKLYVKAGVDILFIGDDIGMQNNIMMSVDMYVKWLKPRLKHLIDEVKNINPNVIVFYHSCGYIIPLIPHLIEAGIDVLNPIQTECMDFKEVYDKFNNKLSFHGTIGTQKVMPLGTPEEVRDEVFKNLDIAKTNGGLFVAPTHLLEPDVPWENIMAYVQACTDYKR